MYLSTAAGHDRAESAAGQRRHGVGHAHNSDRLSVQETGRGVQPDRLRVVLVR